MRFQFALTSVVLAASAALQVHATPQGCGTRISEAQFEAAHDHFLANQVPVDEFIDLDSDTITIPVHYHIIMAGDSEEEGNIPHVQIQASIDALNEDYSASPLQFVLVNTTRTYNPTWFHKAADETDEEVEMKETLRYGTGLDLNIYTVNFTTIGTLLGYATFPMFLEDEFWKDGVVLKYNTVPGGSAKNYNGGQVLTHEVGHWLGLYHTFQGGCTGVGDEVDDTPAEAGPTHGCPTEPQDTCPGDKHVDPIHNYMDYTLDHCKTEFTPGQITRFISQIATYRY